MKREDEEKLGQAEPQKRTDYVKPMLTRLKKLKNVTAGLGSPL